MAKTTTELLAQREAESKEFLDILERIDGLLWEAARMLRAVITASKSEAALKDGAIGGGSVTLTLTPKVNPKGVTELGYKLSYKLPEKKRAATTFFAHADGKLQPTPEMEQVEMYGERKIAAAADDTTIGEAPDEEKKLN